MPLGQVSILWEQRKMLLEQIKMPLKQMRTFLGQLAVAEALKDLLSLKYRAISQMPTIPCLLFVALMEIISSDTAMGLMTWNLHLIAMCK